MTSPSTLGRDLPALFLGVLEASLGLVGHPYSAPKLASGPYLYPYWHHRRSLSILQLPLCAKLTCLQSNFLFRYAGRQAHSPYHLQQ